MYATVADPYCYPGTDILKNKPGFRDEAALRAFEAISAAQRADELMPSGHFSVTHYRAIHRHIFQDVYRWAGRFRTVRISKGGNMFCYPENIAPEMRALFSRLADDKYLRDLSSAEFSRKAAEFLATLNAIHPFREGNGRAQTSFLVLLAANAGHPIDLGKLNPESFLNGMMETFGGNERELAAEVESLIA